MVHFCGERKGREKREGEKEKREERKGGKSQHFQLDVSQVPQSHYGNNQLEISPCLPQLEKARTARKTQHSHPPKKKFFLINLKKYCNVGISAYDTEKYMCIAMYEIPNEQVK